MDNSLPSWAVNVPVGAQIEQTTQEDISSTKMAATFQQIRAETDSLTVAPAANLEIKAEQPAAYSSASHILLLIDLTSAAVYAPALQVLLSLLKTVSFNASTGRGSARSCIGALGYHGGGTDILKKFNPVCAEDVKAVAELIRKPPPLPKPKSNETSMAAARIGTSFSPLRAALMKSLGMLSPLANKNIKKPSSTQAADEKSVWIITDQQEGTDEIVMACRDGEENGVEYHVLYFGEGDGSWWERIGGLTAIDDEAASDPEEVLPALRTLINKARRLSILDLSIPTGGKIRVEVYKLVVKRGRPASVFVDARSNQPVKAVSHHLDMVTGEILPSKSVETYMSLGSSKVKVTPNDIQKIKEKSSGKEAGGVIVGFKPLSTLRPEMRVDTSFHIHPFVSAKRTASKADAINVSAFQALWDGMKRKGVYALARILVRHPGVQRFAALTAVDNGGLTCIWLPFEDDLRIPPPVPEYKANGVQVEAAVGMFEAMDISGIEWGYSFRNPSLSKFWRYLESVAINCREEEENDLEVPVDSIMASASSEIEEFTELLPEHIEVEKKRKSAGGAPKEKKPKVLPEDDSGVDWQLRLDSRTVQEITVDKLKVYLRSKGLPLGGNKKVLVERIYEDANNAAEKEEFMGDL